MRPFKYVRADDPRAAASAVAANPRAKFLAGGTNLLDLMKEDVERPDELVDLTRLPQLAEIRAAGGGVSLGALAKNADTANHPLIRQNYPLLTQAIVAGASAQLRNMATNGGNLLQRTRCMYFYDPATPCNKREPGTGCSALRGLNRMHAILGWSEQCVATYPGDMANALYALDAVVRVRGGDGAERTIPIQQFHRLPEDAPHRDSTLAHGELIVSIDLPPSPFARNSHYLKVRDRASYAFALVAVAAGLEMEGGTIRDSRVVMGSVAHKPWRSEEAEAVLAGAPATEASFTRAAEAALADARPLEHNGYKVELAKRAVVRALMRAARLA
ncbi:FAD binding domain-containing protein [Longimicrobium terrae]|uniref:Xanthine dehydrogenase YagS FAD-binding subunit n=1 Tax=Longimicrobium terrae TaxID=1639882 RepID=A0A841H068_9BACT|nr:xanthine dehydrogenase family protein subunit M [Longimicrobium terrae]MBB4636990.1 xanthine dehydrogenase YagS FAD-binding subunit [Longimicrobium terrae]MBB6071402.1 xanthine dehydrogenase YagS FAD-binding subunit [Longimicrobium terrae]NNC31383.1 xanthine dehydrogenase family protein subunit M [Longimicrobium terrae]